MITANTSFIGKLRSIVELATTVGVLVTVVVFLAAVWGSQKNRPSTTRKTYLVGERLDIPAVTQPESNRPTTVLFLRTSCKFCAESIGFYKRLASTANRGSIVVVTEETTEAMRAYLQEQGLSVDRIISMTPSSLAKLKGTPTLLVVGPDGLIKKVRLGLIPEGRDQDEIVHEIVVQS